MTWKQNVSLALVQGSRQILYEHWDSLKTALGGVQRVRDGWFPGLIANAQVLGAKWL